MFSHSTDLDPYSTQDLGLLAPALSLIPAPPPSLWQEWYDAHLARLPAQDYPQADGSEKSTVDRAGTPGRAALPPVSSGRLT